MRINDSARMLVWGLVFVAVLAWSAIGPHDRFTWWLEVIPALIAAVLLWGTKTRFPLTRLVYVLILIHAIILMVGGHYTYAEVPLFDYIGNAMGWTRNHYDKLGHFAQGFVPAMVAREILLRRTSLTEGKWLGFLVTCVALAFSAFYELIEWWVAELTGGDAEAFLGTQGYVWDTQSDMMFALIGAIAALTLLSGVHSKQIAALARR